MTMYFDFRQQAVSTPIEGWAADLAYEHSASAYCHPDVMSDEAHDRYYADAAAAMETANRAFGCYCEGGVDGIRPTASVYGLVGIEIDVDTGRPPAGGFGLARFRHANKRTELADVHSWHIRVRAPRDCGKRHNIFMDCCRAAYESCDRGN